MADEFITLKEAAELVGVSRATLWRRMKEPGHEVQVYQAQEDRRIRLVKRGDIEDMLKPRPVKYTPELASKMAA